MPPAPRSAYAWRSPTRATASRPVSNARCVSEREGADELATRRLPERTAALPLAASRAKALFGRATPQVGRGGFDETEFQPDVEGDRRIQVDLGHPVDPLDSPATAEPGPGPGRQGSAVAARARPGHDPHRQGRGRGRPRYIPGRHRRDRGSPEGPRSGVVAGHHPGAV